MAFVLMNKKQTSDIRHLKYAISINKWPLDKYQMSNRNGLIL